MNDKMPRTPFSTPLSGSARETELRLKHIFSGPKKRPPVVFLTLMFLVCVFCGNLVSCQVAGAETDTTDTSLQPGDVSQPEPKEPEYLPASELSFDLNHNGIPEEIRLENEYGWDEVRFYENGQITDRELPGVCLYSYTGGPDYILRCYDGSDFPGAYYYSYHIADSSGEFEEVIQYNSIRFDLNFNAPFHTGFDPAAIAAYVEELTGPAGLPSLGLFSHTWRLVVRDGELAAEDLTVIHYAFAAVDDTGRAVLADPAADLANLAELRALREGAAEDRRRLGRVYTVLGVAGGLLLVILLI